MAADPCNFDTLFSKNVPHILENIFFSVGYASYKICLEVNSEWKELLTSERYITKGKTVFKEEIMKDEEKLSKAARADNTDEARMILATGMVDINCRFGHFGSTPLLEAAMQGQKDVAQLLIESGAELSKADIRGRTPLHWAAINSQKEVAQLLIESGADLNVADEGGRTPLHRAAMNGHTEVAKLLIESGADIDEADNQGHTPRQLFANLSITM